MITCKLLLCAQGVVRDAETGGISIYNIFEGIQVASFPFFIQQMDIFGLFTRIPEDDAQYDVSFRVALGDTELVTGNLLLDFGNKFRNRAVLHIQGLIVPQPGQMTVSAQHADTLLGTYELTVEQILPPRLEARQEPVGVNAREERPVSR